MSPTKRRRSPSCYSDSDSPPSFPSAKQPRIALSDHNPDQINIFILPAKMDTSQLTQLVALSERSGTEPGKLHLNLCSDVRQADIVVTMVRMRKRLERHSDWDIAKDKAIVTPQWLLDSAAQRRPQPCEPYAALPELHDETAQNCPDSDCESDSETADNNEENPRPPDHSFSPTAASGNLDHSSPYACCRGSPLLCCNQELVDQLEILRYSRELEGENMNSLAYERAIGVIKAYPYKIDTIQLHDELPNLPGIGRKTLHKIEEYIESGGCVHESGTIRNSERYQTLSLFTTVYSIGPATARKLYSLGLRTIKDLKLYYDVSDTIPAAIPQSPSEPPGLDIATALTLRDEFLIKVPRHEIEQMHSIVMHELDSIHKGWASTIVGGYRRGKKESNDVDIVITNVSIKDVRAFEKMASELVQRLYEKGRITHVIRLSGFHNASKNHPPDHTLHNFLTVFLPPQEGTTRPIHRRLDLIFAPHAVYWTAVAGWTGSKMFERDLRKWAKDKKGLKFDSYGITRRSDTHPVFASSEREVFDILGLEWVDPTLRNADA